MGKASLIKALRMKGAAQPAMDLELSPMTDETPKRYGIQSQIENG
jgi:hypothetical protein